MTNNTHCSNNATIRLPDLNNYYVYEDLILYMYLTLLKLFSSVRSYRVAPLTLQKAKLSALAEQTWHCYNLIILMDRWRHHNLLGSGQNLYLGNGQSASWQTALSFLRQCVCEEVITDHCMGES